MNIIKRSGEEKTFVESKILAAVKKANKSVSPDKALKDWQINVVVKRVSEEASSLNRAVKVEEIQDLVEQAIMGLGAYEVAKSYVIYRYERTLARKGNSTDGQILSIVDCNNEEVKQENSNKNPTVVSVQRDYIAGETSKDISRRLILPKDVVKAHDEGIIHFHDMDYFVGHMHNCFHSTTRFVTDKGLVEFGKFHDGDKVVVKDLNGVNRVATVRRYGKQKLFDVILKNGRMTHEVKCTRDHRWVLEDGTITTNLKVGDYLWKTIDSSSYEISDYDDADKFCIGFALGYGCDHGCCDKTQVRLCGEKRVYSYAFEMCGWHKYNVKNSEDIVYYKDDAFKQTFLESKSWRFMNARQKEMLFHGLYAADGNKNATRIATADKRIVEMIESVSSMAGFYVTSKKDVVRSTNYKKDAYLCYIHFICKNIKNQKWRVDSIVPSKSYTDYVWCVEEPVTHTFTLEKGIVTGNCDLVNLGDMLQNGTVISGTMIEKPHSFYTACNISTQIIAQVASCQYGGQSISLSHLAPFVEVSRQKIRKDLKENLEKIGTEMEESKFDALVESMVREEVKRGVQTIQYQVVTLMTTNGQAPFITVFMYLNEVKDDKMKADLAMIIEEVLEQRIQGVKNEVGVYITPAFPKLVYVLEEDNIHEGSKYWYLTELAAKCTAKRLVPDYISEKVMKTLKVDADGDGYCYTPMGCRSFLTVPRGEVEKGKFYGRFNQGVVTINLVDVALSSEGNLEKFWEILGERCELCHKALQCRHERLTGTLSDAAPILWQYGAISRLPKGEKIDKLLHGGYSTISLGYAGLWECVFAMTGKKLTEKEGEEFGLKVMEKLNEYTAKWKAAEDIDYSLYGTPLESTTYKFAKCLQKRFGVIKGVTDRQFITNSYHVHVEEKINAFEKLALEAKFQRLSPGGAISYVEIPNMQNNLKAVESIMRFIYDNILYAELNTKSDYCQCCGFDGEIKIVTDENGKLVWECPMCGNRDQSKLNVARRSCGYIGSQFWNQGRTQEIKNRVVHVD